VYDRLSRVARAESTVLITGETGTGKELAARAIHLNGPRVHRPFVAINCAAVAENLLESEMFGHERGAFTGAVALKKGKFELADGGTLFLDEVADLAAPLQSKLLRALQQQEFERVGGTRTIKVDVRVIAATNAVLSEEVAKGKFRSDLYFRLNVVNITMPPLRERPSDIPLLARYFLERFGPKAGRRITGFSAAAMSCLTAHRWPGNVRELQNIIERAAVLGIDQAIVPDDLPEDLVESHIAAGTGEGADYHAAVHATKRRVIIEAFRQSGGSYVATARLLGLHPNYLHRLIRVLNLKPELEPER
jgi:transcriptional regulator with GAF, ATPase, and Fis domain